MERAIVILVHRVSREFTTPEGERPIECEVRDWHDVDPEESPLRRQATAALNATRPQATMTREKPKSEIRPVAH